jgi:hypothetical protein
MKKDGIAIRRQPPMMRGEGSKTSLVKNHPETRDAVAGFRVRAKERPLPQDRKR